MTDLYTQKGVIDTICRGAWIVLTGIATGLFFVFVLGFMLLGWLVALVLWAHVSVWLGILVLLVWFYAIGSWN